MKYKNVGEERLEKILLSAEHRTMQVLLREEHSRHEHLFFDFKNVKD